MKIGKISDKRFDYGSYSDVSGTNLGYYNNNNIEYAKISSIFDMSETRNKMLSYGVPDGGEILDAGCGAGCDTIKFGEQGYKVTSFDGSEGMVEVCKEKGIPCIHKDFLSIDFKNEFDAVWASASLLHLPYEAFEPAIANLTAALKPGGIFYFSIKKLENGFLEDSQGSLFYNPGQERLDEIFQNQGLSLLDTWESGKQNDPNQVFVSYILKKN